jgi:Transposase zinc-ribbon domain
MARVDARAYGPVMVGMNPLPRTLTEAVNYFALPENCLSYLAARRWPNGITCPTCGSAGVSFDRTRMDWICKSKHPRRKLSFRHALAVEWRDVDRPRHWNRLGYEADLIIARLVLQARIDDHRLDSLKRCLRFT